MPASSNSCTSLQSSLGWCEGTPELPGLRKRLYYIAKDQVVQWPTLPHDANGRLTAATYSGSFVIDADAAFLYIDILTDKSQLTSEAQGEYPSQTQLNKLTAVHPGVGEEASAAAAYLNNTDSIFVVQDMRGRWRVIGSEKWMTKTTVAQDNGQGATGTTSTTISVEASDECPAPFYTGILTLEDGNLNCGPADSDSDGESGGSGHGSPSGMVGG